LWKNLLLMECSICLANVVADQRRGEAASVCMRLFYRL
jgi:hypothetical protein